MNKNKKYSIKKNNKTQKIKNDSCNYLIYQPFEKEYKKTLRYGNTKTTKIISFIN